jgi:uncharacterized protein (TIGR00251 family)
LPPPADASPVSLTDKGLQVALRLQPGASRDAIDGLVELDGGQVALRVRVTAPAVDGKANAALIKLLAKAWKLPKSSLSLVAGRQDRRKILAVEGEPKELLPRLEAWLKSLPAT